MPVREALILLEYQGLVERFPNNHVRVTEFGEDYFGEVFRFCAELEEKALMSQPVFQEDEKSSRFKDGVLEETLLHRQIKPFFVSISRFWLNLLSSILASHLYHDTIQSQL